MHPLAKILVRHLCRPHRSFWRRQPNSETKRENKNLDLDPESLTLTEPGPRGRTWSYHASVVLLVNTVYLPFIEGRCLPFPLSRWAQNLCILSVIFLDSVSSVWPWSAWPCLGSCNFSIHCSLPYALVVHPCHVTKYIKHGWRSRMNGGQKDQSAQWTGRLITRTGQQIRWLTQTAVATAVWVGHLICWPALVINLPVLIGPFGLHSFSIFNRV